MTRVLAAMALTSFSPAGLLALEPFVMSFDGCQTFSGPAGEPYFAEVYCVLSSSLDPGEGAQGWALSMTTDGVDVVGATTDGTAVDPNFSGGFKKTELTSKSTGDCTGHRGVVSAVVLTFGGTETLPPQGDSTVCSLRLAGFYPPSFLPRRGTLAYVDGCHGSGPPVQNQIIYQGELFKPRLVACEVSVLGYEETKPLCPPRGAELALRVPEATLLEPGKSSQITVPAGSNVVVAAIESNLGTDTGGVQGWSLAGRVWGQMELLDATTAGTSAAEAPIGRRVDGFEQTVLVNPETTFPGSLAQQGPGFVSAVVLSLKADVTLPAIGVEPVLRIRLGGEAHQVGGLAWVDGLRRFPNGEPVVNTASVGGRTRDFDCLQDVIVVFTPPDGQRFRRCDANDDGAYNVSDPIAVLRWRFSGTSSIHCPEVADCNGDGKRGDITDAIYSLSNLFLGGPPPPAPFPGCDTVAESIDCPVAPRICR